MDVALAIRRVNGEEVRLMLWDTAGQEEFDAITKAYYRGAQAAVLAFSTVDRVSFDAIRAWKKKASQFTSRPINSYIVALNGPNPTSVQQKKIINKSTKNSRQVEDECGEIPMVLVQNKIDLADQAVVDT